MTSQFSDIEFKDMMFNPFRVPDGTSIFEYYTPLKKYKIFKKSAGRGLDVNKLMEWIVCMYDKNTPYRLKFKNVLKRKLEIAHDVGFEIGEGGKFIDPVEDFLKGKNRTVNAKIVEYIRIHRDFKYAYLVGIENSYYQIMEVVISGDTTRIKELKEIQVELEDTMIDILNKDDNPFVSDMLLRYMEEDRLHLRPEDIAMKLSKGEQAITLKELR